MIYDSRYPRFRGFARNDRLPFVCEALNRLYRDGGRRCHEANTSLALRPARRCGVRSRWQQAERTGQIRNPDYRGSSYLTGHLRRWNDTAPILVPDSLPSSFCSPPSPFLFPNPLGVHLSLPFPSAVLSARLAVLLRGLLCKP